MASDSTFSSITPSMAPSLRSNACITPLNLAASDDSISLMTSLCISKMRFLTLSCMVFKRFSICFPRRSSSPEISTTCFCTYRPRASGSLLAAASSAASMSSSSSCGGDAADLSGAIGEAAPLSGMAVPFFRERLPRARARTRISSKFMLNRLTAASSSNKQVRRLLTMAWCADTCVRQVWTKSSSSRSRWKASMNSAGWSSSLPCSSSNVNTSSGVKCRGTRMRLKMSMTWGLEKADDNVAELIRKSPPATSRIFLTRIFKSENLEFANCWL
mmetsp:Transcript_712/g.1589  ORF Transcript_712/g.1589 Transcript_712/m.1589 type:complete len:273 (-) Transcript_712:1072-1890(-)